MSSFFDENRLVGFGRVDAHQAVLDDQPAFDEPAYRKRVDAVLLLQHARSERPFGVLSTYRHGGLDDDRTVSDLRRDEMHRAAVKLHAFLERAAVRVESGKRGKQGRMDVDYPARVAPHDIGAENAHEPREDDQIGRMPVDRVRERGLEGLARGKLPVVDHLGRNTRLLPQLQSRRVGPIADHGGDFRGKTCAGDRPEVATSAGNEDDELLHAAILPSGLRAGRLRYAGWTR